MSSLSERSDAQYMTFLPDAARTRRGNVCNHVPWVGSSAGPGGK